MLCFSPCLFRWRHYISTRDDFKSLAAGELATADVLTVWFIILNHLEKTKSSVLPHRFFGTFVQTVRPYLHCIYINKAYFNCKLNSAVVYSGWWIRYYEWACRRICQCHEWNTRWFWILEIERCSFGKFGIIQLTNSLTLFNGIHNVCNLSTGILPSTAWRSLLSSRFRYAQRHSWCSWQFAAGKFNGK